MTCPKTLNTSAVRSNQFSLKPNSSILSNTVETVMEDSVKNCQNLNYQIRLKFVEIEFSYEIN